MQTRFLKKIFFNGTIETISGLHISSHNDAFSLGILDHTIIRDPLTQLPFIPGSSIKGKIRYLLNNFLSPDSAENTDSQQADSINTLFGMSSKTTHTSGARIIFRDAHFSEKSRNAELPFADLPYTEVKKEAFIDRHTGRATPTLIERVPAGLSFDVQIILNIFEGDPEEIFIKTILHGLNLLQDDYLGGRGTRGYGVVKIHLTPISYKDQSHYLDAKDAEPYPNIAIPESLT